MWAIMQACKLSLLTDCCRCCLVSSHFFWILLYSGTSLLLHVLVFKSLATHLSLPSCVICQNVPFGRNYCHWTTIHLYGCSRCDSTFRQRWCRRGRWSVLSLLSRVTVEGRRRESEWHIVTVHHLLAIQVCKRLLLKRALLTLAPISPIWFFTSVNHYLCCRGRGSLSCRICCCCQSRCSKELMLIVHCWSCSRCSRRWWLWGSNDLLMMM